MIDEPARSVDVTGEDVAHHVAADVDGVAAQPTDHAGLHPWRRREDVDRVIALEGVDLEHLDAHVRDPQADAIDRLRGDDDVVGVLGAQDDQLVEAGAAVDRDGRVHVVHDLVLTGPGADVGLRGGREAARQLRHRDHRLGVQPDDLAGRAVGVGIARRAGRGSTERRLGEREAADDEQVVARDALQPQWRLVGVDDERVIAGAALGEDGLAVAAAQPAAGGRDRGEHILRRERPAVGVAQVQVAVDRAGGGGRAQLRRVAEQAVDLADLEGVVAVAAVQRGGRAVVVHREVVVAAEPVDVEAAVDAGVVVDPLHRLDANRGAAARVGRGHVVGEHADRDAGDSHRTRGNLFGGQRHAGRDRLGEDDRRTVKADALDRVVA